MFVICYGENDRRSAAFFDVAVDVIGIITNVRDEDLGSGQFGIDKVVITLAV